MTLFDNTPAPMFRSTDPETSAEAAAKVLANGSAASDRAKCLKAVTDVPGLTSDEIADMAGIARHAAARRLPELRRAGLVHNGPARASTLTGNTGITWRLGPKPPENEAESTETP